MSFSYEVKEELSKLNNLANKKQVKAELLGYLMSNNVSTEKKKLKFSTENSYNINRFNKLLSNTNIPFQIDIQGKVYTIRFVPSKLLPQKEEIARAYSHSYQKIKKGLPAATLFLCIAYQFLTWGCPALALSMTCFSSSSSKQ